jgi:hypothetical protein
LDEISKALLRDLRSKDQAALSPEDANTLEMLEELEDGAKVKKATLDEFSEMGEGRTPGRRVCPACKSPNLTARSLTYSVRSTCLDCGATWEGSVAPPSVALPTRGPYSRPSGVLPSSESVGSKSYFRNPKKVRR